MGILSGSSRPFVGVQQRWCGRGKEPPTDHAAMTSEGALAETLAACRRYHLPIKKGLPLVVRAIRLEVSQLLDVTVGAVRQRLRVSAERMTTTASRRSAKAARKGRRAAGARSLRRSLGVTRTASGR